MTSSDQSVHVLIARYITGELTEEEAVCLLAMLQDNAELQRLFLDNVRLDWALRKRGENLNALQQASQEDDSINWNDYDWTVLLDWEKNAVPLAGSSRLRHNDSPSPPSEKVLKPVESASTRKVHTDKRKQSFGRFFWVCLCVFIFLVGYSEYLHHYRNTKCVTHLAQIKEIIDPVWDNNNSYKRGQFIATDKIQLKSGSVLLEFVNGTRMVLQGPNSFVIVNAKSVYCDFGQVFATVPPAATGFELATPFGSVRDLGTQFFADVRERHTSVGVVQGKVELRTPAKPPVLLTANKELQIDRFKNIVAKDFSKESFVDETAFQAALEQYVSRENENKQQKDALENALPNLLARFDFSKWTGGPVANTSQRGRMNLPQAEVIGCRPGQGTLDGRSSICFATREDYVEAILSGSYQSLTLTTFVRVDQLDRPGNVLLESKEFFNRGGSFLWQLTGEGYLQFHLYCGSTMSSVCSNSGICISGKDLGTWIKLTCVADAQQKTISHYVDDQLITSTPWPDPVPIVPGSLMIGNGKTKKSRSTQNDRFFAGAMSELAVYDSAITPTPSEK
ncbi:MAG: FecR domain-containing protein [Thermoguttaceae bacterium]|nr:FecR domain-containing protein [Thermoguttaceae bacterium]